MRHLLFTSLLLFPFAHFGVSAQEHVSEPSAVVHAEGRYWVTASTGKTHNSSCRYYENSRGYHSSTGTGNNCKICGGAAR